MDELQKRCDVGWILAEHGGRCSWSVAKKTGSTYPSRRWSLWTFAVTLLPDIPFATHHNRLFSEPPMPTHNRLFSEPPTFGGMQHTLSQTKKLVHFTPGRWTPATPPSGKIFISEKCTWHYLIVCEISAF